MSQEKFQRAGQFVLEKCMLYTSGSAVIDLKGGGNVISISFFEDMSTPFVQGTLLFSNTGAASQIGPIIGQETLDLVIRTPSMEKEEDILTYTGNKRLHITKFNTRRHLGQGTEVLSLEFISAEWVRHTQTRVSRTLTGSISSMVDHMLTSVGCQKVKYIEPSAENKRYVAPNLRPFDVVKHLMPQAISAKGGKKPEPTYMFWENKQGYHFRSLTSCVNGDTDYSSHTRPIMTYKTKDKLTIGKGGDLRPIDELKTILDFQITHSDFIENNFLGNLSSDLISHNIYEKSYGVSNFNYFSDFDRSTKMWKEGYPLYSKTPDINGNKIGDIPTATFLQPNCERNGKDAGFSTDTGNYIYSSYSPESFIQSRRSAMNMLFDGVSIQMQVHGNTFVNAGDMVEVGIPYKGIKDAESCLLYTSPSPRDS